MANRVNTTLTYVHQDSLNSTSLVTTDSGTLESAAAYLPFGGIRTGSVSTEQKFTGQRLDDTGLYYYNARYYDATIGRFISPDTVVQNPANPQTLNRYSYCLNNPLKYTDPTGHVNTADDGSLGEVDTNPPPPNPQTPAPAPIEPNLPLDEPEPTLVKSAMPIVISIVVGAALSPIPGDELVAATISIVVIGALLAYEHLFWDSLVMNKTITANIYLDETIDDIQEHPENWEEKGEKSEPSTSYKGGTSTETTYRNRETGEEVTRHTIRDKNGKVKHQHWRIP